MYDLWWTDTHWNRHFSEYLGFHLPMNPVKTASLNIHNKQRPFSYTALTDWFPSGKSMFVAWKELRL
jgi:hypothetical protein